MKLYMISGKVFNNVVVLAENILHSLHLPYHPHFKDGVIVYVPQLDVIMLAMQSRLGGCYEYPVSSDNIYIHSDI